MPGESFIINCSCEVTPGTTPPDTTQYVVSLNDLVGQVTLAGTGATSITSSGNTITIGLSAAAGLGSVTSVALSSSNSNLVVVSGSPVTTNGTIALDFAGNLDSISGLVMAADQMLYSTSADTFAATSLTSFARTLLDDANNTAARSTLGVVIGTNVQAWSADLDSFVTNATWTGGDLDITSGLLTAGAFAGGSISVTGDVGLGGDVTGAVNGTFSGILTAASLVGDGAGITGVPATSISSGTLAVARGGTNIASYAVGDIIYASGATTLSKLADVAAGSFLRSGGVATAPAWSTLVIPNAATTGDVFYASASNTMARLTAVATGNALISGGVTTAPSWGKITSSHVNTTIPTMSGGINADITTMSGLASITSTEVEVSGIFQFLGELQDANDSPGNSGDILKSTGTGVEWSTQIAVSTLRIDSSWGMEGTITAGGVTGAQTINKPSGTVNFAAAATSLVVTNSLATTSHRVMCTVCTNDTTMKAAAAVVTNGSFTIYADAAPTAETAVYWQLTQVT